MEPEGMVATAPRGRGLPIATALATFWFSASIGSVVFGRWRRAAVWLAIDWSWLVLMIAGVRWGQPRVMWGALAGVVVGRVPAAVDAFLLARRTRAEARWSRVFLAWCVLSVFGAVVPSWIVRPFFVEAFLISSAGMAPTLVIGDHIMVDKHARQPRPGDVIVFEFPLDRSTDYVKRVIAVGGDIVQIDDGTLIVNGKEVWRERVQNGCAGDPDAPTDGPCVIWEETLEEHRYQTGYDRFGGPRYTDRRLVKPGTVFVLGDNRDNSSDSRVWGDVPLENVKGTVRFVWWSADKARVNLIVR